VTFIDDKTRKVWIYFMKHKDDAFHKFKLFKHMLENEAGWKIKVLKIVHGA
jgi:5'-3' exoribonuclease 2